MPYDKGWHLCVLSVYDRSLRNRKQFWSLTQAQRAREKLFKNRNNESILQFT